ARHRDLHSFPTRRSSDLAGWRVAGGGLALGGGGLLASLLGSLAKVLGDLGHVVVSPRSQRSGDAAVLADPPEVDRHEDDDREREDRKSTRLNSSHVKISY